MVAAAASNSLAKDAASLLARAQELLDEVERMPDSPRKRALLRTLTFVRVSADIASSSGMSRLDRRVVASVNG
jgi:hypothetical protein